MTDPGWVVTPKPAPPELAKDFHAEPYTDPEPLRTDTVQEPERDPFLVSVQERIGAAKMEELLAIFGGYPIDPSIP